MSLFFFFFASIIKEFFLFSLKLSGFTRIYLGGGGSRSVILGTHMLFQCGWPWVVFL